MKPETWLVSPIRIAPLLAIVISLVALAANPACATTVQRSGGRWTLENSSLKVTLTPSAGLLDVYDKGSRATWHQAANRSHSSFRNVTRTSSEGVRFETTCHDDQAGAIRARVELRLPEGARDLSLSVDLNDPKTPIGGFDFIEPFEPTGNSFLVVADYTDGHMYPCDLDSWPLYNLDHIHVNALDMPWIGIFDLKTGQGYSVMVDTPYDATFKCIKFGRLRAPMVYWESEKGLFGYRRTLTYHFTAKGGYVALAKAFRAHTLLNRLADKAKRNPNIKKLYGAPELWDFYANVPDREMRALGVVKCVHHVQSWADHGDAVKAANRLGFITEDYDYYLDAHPVGSEHPYLSGSSGSGYYDTNDHLVVEKDGKYRGQGEWFVRCPHDYITVARQIIPGRLAKYPTSAIYFDQITADYLGVADGEFGGGSLQECWSPVHPETRTQWHTDVCRFLKYITGLGVIPAAEHGKWWEVPYTSIFYGIPSVQWPWPDVTFPTKYEDNAQWRFYKTWGSLGHAYRVPLWELVYHDSAVAMWYPWDVNDVTVNIPGDWMLEKKDASSVLYGVPAGFMVNGAGTGSWFKDRSKFLTSYRDTCKILESLADKEMVSHTFMTPDRDVQQTTWSDGTKIVVNFGPRDYSAGRWRLKQYGWVATGPWGQMTKVWDNGVGRAVTTISKNGYYFNDRQSCSKHPVALSYSRTAANRITINVDRIDGGDVAFKLTPSIVQPGWSLKTTRIYQCDPTTGDRIRELAWTRSGPDSMAVGPLSGWIVLNVVTK